MEVTTIGLDLAKNVFQVHGITEDEEVVFNRPLRRAQLLPFFSKIERCLIGMEACSSAHYWARELTALGHEVRLIPPIYVKAYGVFIASRLPNATASRIGRPRTSASPLAGKPRRVLSNSFKSVRVHFVMGIFP